MDKIKGVAKEGWHPTGSDGKSKESWRHDFKGVNQVAGWVGKRQDPRPAAQEHQSRPLASLKDPDAFPPPPKNVHYHEVAASPQAITPDRRELGASVVSAEEIRVQREREESEERTEEIQKPVPPSIPYRADTTGLSTSNLPKPPVRRAAVGDHSSAQASSNAQAKGVVKKPKPSLPPRLPPREPSTLPQDPPPSYNSAIEDPTAHTRLNQSALNRLGSAGIFVPGLNIGGSLEASMTHQDQAGIRNASPAKPQKPTLGDLHAQFSGVSNKMPRPEPLSNEGTTFAQKQAALKAANSFRSDPSSVSLSDAKATAVTAHNFHERHGDQVASGLRTAHSINQKYDIAGKVGSHTGNLSTGQEALDSPALDRDLKDKKKPPPVPLSSKPRF